MFDFHGTKETCCCRPDCAAQLDQGGFKRFAFQQQTEGLHLYPSPAVSKGKKNIKKHAESQLLIHLVQFYGGHISERTFMCRLLFNNISEVKLNISFK